MSGTGNQFFPKAIEYVTIAIEADNAEDYEKALKYYDCSFEYFMTGLKHEKNPIAKETIQKRVSGYMTRAEALKKVISEQQAAKQTKNSGTTAVKSRTEEGILYRPFSPLSDSI